MGVYTTLVIEPPTVDFTPSKEEVEAYYLQHCPPGSPPLADIEKHVRQALAVLHRERQPSDPIHAPLERFSHKTLSFFAIDIEALATIHGWPEFFGFVAEHELKWYPPEDGLALFEPLLARIRSEIDGKVATRKPRGVGVYLPIKKHKKAWEDVLELLDVWVEVLQTAEQERRFRIQVDS